MKIYTLTQYTQESVELPCVVVIPKGMMVKIAHRTTAFNPKGERLDWFILVDYPFIVCVDMEYQMFAVREGYHLV